MRELRITVHLVVCLGISMVLCLAPRECLAAKKKGAAPIIVVGVADWCGFCKQLKERLANDPTVTPLSSHFQISYVDVDDKARAAAFAKRFRLQQVSLPTLVVAAPNGTPVEVSLGAPQKGDLPKLLQQALMKMGIRPDVVVAQADKKEKEKEKEEKEPRARKTAAKEKEKDPEMEAQVAALREARKLLSEKKTAEAVALVAPYAGKPRATGALGGFISSLEKEGHALVASAREQLEKPDRLAVGAVALVKARRLYGKLPAIEEEISAGLAVLAKAPQGDEICKQAEAVDKGRALDEAGDPAAAIKVYRSVAAQFANTQVAEMAAKRIETLQRAAEVK